MSKYVLAAAQRSNQYTACEKRMISSEINSRNASSYQQNLKNLNYKDLTEALSARFQKVKEKKYNSAKDIKLAMLFEEIPSRFENLDSWDAPSLKFLLQEIQTHKHRCTHVHTKGPAIQAILDGRRAEV